MPEIIERKLKKEALKKGFKPGSTRYQAYVYGTLYRLKQKAKRVRTKRRTLASKKK